MTSSIVVMTTYNWAKNKTWSAVDFLQTNMAGDNRGMICTIFPCNYLFAHEKIFIAVLNLCSLWEFSQEHFLRFTENNEFSLKSIYVRIFRYHCNCTCRTDNVHTNFPSLSTFLGHELRLATPYLATPYLATPRHTFDLHRNFLRWSFNNLQLFRRH